MPRTKSMLLPSGGGVGGLCLGCFDMPGLHGCALPSLMVRTWPVSVFSRRLFTMPMSFATTAAFLAGACMGRRNHACQGILGKLGRKKASGKQQHSRDPAKTFQCVESHTKHPSRLPIEMLSGCARKVSGRRAKWGVPARRKGTRAQGNRERKSCLPQKRHMRLAEDKISSCSRSLPHPRSRSVR